jgi:hypothetical protein
LPQAEDTSPQVTQIASARCVWLACLAVVVCLRLNRGPTVVFLRKSSTTKAVFPRGRFQETLIKLNLNY